MDLSTLATRLEALAAEIDAAARSVQAGDPGARVRLLDALDRLEALAVDLRQRLT